MNAENDYEEKDRSDDNNGRNRKIKIKIEIIETKKFI